MENTMHAFVLQYSSVDHFLAQGNGDEIKAKKKPKGENLIIQGEKNCFSTTWKKLG